MDANDAQHALKKNYSRSFNHSKLAHKTHQKFRVNSMKFIKYTKFSQKFIENLKFGINRK